MPTSGSNRAVLVLASLLWACSAVPSRAADSVARKITVAGIERSYLLSRPAQPGPRPTMIVLHGGTLSASQARRDMHVEPLVDRERLVAVYPDATDHQWNDGRHNGPGRHEDVGFLRALVASLVAERIADPQRIYVTGPSNGGMMTLRLVCEAADLIAAAAPIIASMPADFAPGCKPVRAVPVLVMNGTADPLVPYGGGGVGFRGERGNVISTDATMALLRGLNGCTGAPATERLPDLDPADGSTVTIERWTRCSSGAPVVLYRVEGGGHRVPQRNGRPRPVIDRLLGAENHDFDGIEAIWSFFKDKGR